jgi:hypothetical protein
VAWLSNFTVKREVEMANGTITLVPFIAYYGETSDLRIIGSKVDTPIPLPNRLGASSTDVAPGLAHLFPNAKIYYNSIGQSGGGSHGFNVFAGVAVTES